MWMTVCLHRRQVAPRLFAIAESPGGAQLPDRSSDGDTLLDAQIRYYRARAAEYDATSPSEDHFALELERIRSALRDLAPRGRVLELAAGTGHWTGLLAEFATELAVVDASPEMLRLNAEKTASTRVQYLVSDVFRLRPTAEWDVVFFGLWLSHVPPDRFDDFWDLVAGLLLPGGRAIFVDEVAPGLGNEDWLDESGGVVRRRLSDGSVHRAVKVLWEAEALEARLRDLGWDAEVRAAKPYYWGRATRSKSDAR